MVGNEVEERVVQVDRQGRMVLPSRLREKLGLKKGGRVSIRLEDSSKAVIEPKIDGSVEARVKSWLSIALTTKAQAFTAKIEKRKPAPGWGKWMSSDYARRKLGLSPRH